MTRNMPENRINYKIILSSFCVHFVFDYTSVPSVGYITIVFFSSLPTWFHRFVIFGLCTRPPPLASESDKYRRQIALQTRVLWCIIQFIHILTQMGVASFVCALHVVFCSLFYFAQWGVDKHLEESLLK